MTPDPDWLPAVFQWLDDTFYGVQRNAHCVVLPLSPDTPITVRVMQAKLAGKLFDIRAPFLDRVPLSAALFESIAENNDFLPEGYVRVVPNQGLGAIGPIGHLEIRYMISVLLAVKDSAQGHSLAQYCLRMSAAANQLGPQFQSLFGGMLIRSKG